MGGSVGISKVTQRVTSLVDVEVGVSVFPSSLVTVLTAGVFTSTVVPGGVVGTMISSDDSEDRLPEDSLDSDDSDDSEDSEEESRFLDDSVNPNLSHQCCHPCLLPLSMMSASWCQRGCGEHIN